MRLLSKSFTAPVTVEDQNLFKPQGNAPVSSPEWQPGRDLNPDKLNQNQLCYHYTTGLRKTE